jgi:hypothetical protein
LLILRYPLTSTVGSRLESVTTNGKRVKVLQTQEVITSLGTSKKLRLKTRSHHLSSGCKRGFSNSRTNMSSTKLSRFNIRKTRDQLSKQTYLRQLIGNQKPDRLSLHWGMNSRCGRSFLGLDSTHQT